MKSIKESQLKKIFESYGLNEGIFDIFKKIRISKLEKDVDDIIDKVKNPKEKEALRNLSNAFRKALVAGVFK